MTNRWIKNPLQVFDTCNVHNERAYGLHFHLDRFLKSAATARVEHRYTKKALRDIILATIAAGGRPKKGKDAFAKFWLSAGRYPILRASVCSGLRVELSEKRYACFTFLPCTGTNCASMPPDEDVPPHGKGVHRRCLLNFWYQRQATIADVLSWVMRAW